MFLVQKFKQAEGVCNSLIVMEKQGRFKTTLC